MQGGHTWAGDNKVVTTPAGDSLVLEQPRTLYSLIECCEKRVEKVEVALGEDIETQHAEHDGAVGNLVCPLRAIAVCAFESAEHFRRNEHVQ